MLGKIHAIMGIAIRSSEVINIKNARFCTSWVISKFLF